MLHPKTDSFLHPADRAFLSDIYPLLQEKRLKADLIRAADFVDGQPDRLIILLNEITVQQQPIRDRLVWVVQLAIERRPELMNPEIKTEMAIRFRSSTTDAEIRAFLNIFRNHDLPDEQVAEVFDRCSEFVRNPKKAIAIRVYALYVMARIAKRFPDLQHETILAMDALRHDQTPAMFVACRKVRHEFKSAAS